MVLGIDAGTTSVKTVIFSLTGQILGIARSSVKVIRNERGIAETNMDDLWVATVATVVAASEQVPGAEVIAIGVTGQGDGAWLIDSAGRPVGNAILWMDGRATDRVEQWNNDGKAAAVKDVTGSEPFAGSLPALMEHLSQTAPEKMSAVVSHLNCKDWIRFKLTGEKATDISESSRTYLDTRTMAYSGELFEQLDQSFVAPILPPVKRAVDLGGHLTEAAARELRIASGIPVAVGAVDTVAAAVGLGVIGNDKGYVVLGTTGFVGVNRERRASLKTDLGIVLGTGRGEQVLESLASMSGTPNLDWVRQTLELPNDDWAEVEQEALQVGPGSGGVLYLPYGSPSGERAPFIDTAASASWHGMSITTSPGQLLRSVYEGLACALTECLDLLDLKEPIAISGGGSESDLMCQIVADISGRQIVRQVGAEPGARGAASIALVAAGVQPDLCAAIATLTPQTDVFLPNKDQAALYQELFKVYIETRDALRPLWGALRKLRNFNSQP